ncbi:lycopene cyclase domain protein [Natrinema pellirubrum DSM 15624]|uniref:Lycopene cyclase domain protein n=1 Tax=Natrinema pellirubrum (strain DSM 15624 / CIP 106293 / JCM 10476 / NCIMB 786 / 157) TaxID=797303 RepID=L0JFG7_NATP1|nr:lycopene cyclase domain-containing protein [Natrinema pellirubrum]AGB30275.1 lycopene cyclase domain protein [Natrinema pellirubrum DSM 15624]ELY79052.1 lycopene cyclase domain protein [Natrinema pellirubrum DSM 15624]
MAIQFTYFGIHLAFLLPPILILGWLAIRRDRAWWGVRPLSGLGIMIALAVVYTTPFTNRLIPVGVWWYGDGAVLATVWYTPIEEYIFFVLQPILTALWLFQVGPTADRSLAIPRIHRLLGVAGGLAIAVIGWALLDTTATYYLGWLLLWVGPVLALQWGFGSTYLWTVRRPLLVAIAVPTLYLWLVDRIAIELGVWVISDAYTTGYALFGLPIEEALFFLVTNLFVVQGITMYVWLLDRIGAGSAWPSASPRLPTGSDDR